MAYRYEKNLDGENDLVIDGFEKGIADSPYQGIGNMRNFAIKYYEGVAYINYSRQAVTLDFGGLILLTGSLSGGATSATLSSAWNFPSGTYSTTFTNGDVRNVVFTNGSASVTWSGGLSGAAAAGFTPTAVSHISKYSTQSPAGVIYIQDSTGQVFKQSAVNGSTFSMIGSEPTLSGANGIQFWNNYLFVFSTNRVDICGDGTGDTGVTSSNWNTSTSGSGVWPIKFSGTVTLTATISAGDTSATISSYTDAQGTSRAFWNGPTGVYSMYTGSGRTGDHYLATLTQGVAAFNFTPTAIHSSGSTVFFFPNEVQANINKTWVSRNDGNLYFCNGSTVGSFSVTAFQTFIKGDMTTFYFNYAALSLPKTEVSNNLEEIRNQLIITTDFSIYPWDRFSPQWQNPIPIQESISNIINILNNLYVFAGNKGNIYISNGYSVERYRKLPDYISGVIDPSWNFGGVMSHRQKLWFQAIAINSQTGAAILSGIFSIDLDTKALNMESQHSYGLTPAFLTSTNPGQGCLLIDNTPADYITSNLIISPTVLNYDNYYSSWYQGVSATVGGVDYNTTTSWQNNEPVIETDIVPIGTAVQPKTFSSMEFKLDKPLTTGQSITVYARQSLADSYTLVGTTTTAVLSDFYGEVSFDNWQWIQLKVTASCNALPSVRIREIRLR